MTPTQAFARVLRELRKRKNLSQEQLGLESGYHRTYISMLERGIKSPSLTTLFDLAQALDVTPSVLVSRIEEVLLNNVNAPQTIDKGWD